VQQELNSFLRYLEAERGYSPGTIKAYRRDIEKGLFPFLRARGKFELASVTKDDIRAYLDFLTLEKGNSNITRRRKLAAIKSFFNYLVDNEELKVNPAAGVRSPKAGDKKPVYLTDAECLELIKAVGKTAKRKVRDRDIAIIILFLHTGLRVSELINLKLVDIDLGSAQIKVTRKGKKEQYLHLNGEVTGTLTRYLMTRQCQNGYAFVSSGGQRLNRNYVYGRIRGYLAAAGINKAKRGPHILRHTFCTRLHQKGVDPLVIKELAGHQNLNTTMRYISIEDKEQSEAVDRLELGFWDKGNNRPQSFVL